MTWKLIVILLSTGVYEKEYHNAEDCIMHLHEFAVLAKTDLWLGRCDGPNLQSYVADTAKDLGP